MTSTMKVSRRPSGVGEMVPVRILESGGKHRAVILNNLGEKVIELSNTWDDRALLVQYLIDFYQPQKIKIVE